MYSRFEVILYFTAALKQERKRVKRLALACRAGVNSDKEQWKRFMEDENKPRGSLSKEFVDNLKQLDYLSKTGRLPKKRQVTPSKPAPPERE